MYVQTCHEHVHTCIKMLVCIYFFQRETQLAGHETRMSEQRSCISEELTEGKSAKEKEQKRRRERERKMI
jgi:hypothetical protein